MTDRYPDRAQTRGAAKRQRRAAQAAERANPAHQHDWPDLGYSPWPYSQCLTCGAHRPATTEGKTS